MENKETKAVNIKKIRTELLKAMREREKNAIDEEKIKKIWQRMNENERFGLKFSLFPYWTMAENLTKEEAVKLMKMSEKETGALA
ncbi:MAG: hypothetical protein QW622_03480 [Candidatus Pacearchaeota archaeon]